MVTPRVFAEQYFTALRALLDRVPLDAVAALLSEVEAAWAEHRRIFLIGNGGSAATASHFALDLSKGTRPDPWTGRPIQAIALTDSVPFVTAWANDTDYVHIFSEPLRALGTAGDRLIAISASGNSPNILEAVNTAHALGMRVVALTGCSGGVLAALADVALTIPSHEYGLVEDLHLALNHILTGYMRERLADTPPAADRVALGGLGVIV
jgi:D-sedoheptulose 7-phosphate isomerase